VCRTRSTTSSKRGAARTAVTLWEAPDAILLGTAVGLGPPHVARARERLFPDASRA
jgi:hypothetical protein